MAKLRTASTVRTAKLSGTRTAKKFVMKSGVSAASKYGLKAKQPPMYMKNARCVAWRKAHGR